MFNLNLNSVELQSCAVVAFETANEYFLSAFQWEQVVDDLERLWVVVKPYVAKLAKLTALTFVMVAYAVAFLIALASEKLQPAAVVEEVKLELAEESTVIVGSTDEGKDRSGGLSEVFDAADADVVVIDYKEEPVAVVVETKKRTANKGRKRAAELVIPVEEI